jgi:serine/threonine-protein kinase
MSIDIPNYRLIEKLGTGASTTIYRARSMRTGEDYAVKIVKIQKPEDNAFLDLMRSEHAIGTVIDHPNVRRVFELRLVRQRLRVRAAMLFMEYVEGVTMADRGFSRPRDKYLDLFCQAAEGVHAMHLAGFVHADMKPSNLLVTPNDRVKLIDFGQSHRLGEAKQRVQGTMDFMAPEQVQKKLLDQRTDVFGVGATLFRVLTGKSVATEMNQTMNLQAPLLRRVDLDAKAALQNLPPILQRLIEDCCATDPAQRPPDMPALLHRMRIAQAVLQRTPEEAALVAGGVEEADDLLDADVDLLMDSAAEFDDLLGLSGDDDDKPA